MRHTFDPEPERNPSAEADDPEPGSASGGVRDEEEEEEQDHGTPTQSRGRSSGGGGGWSPVLTQDLARRLSHGDLPERIRAARDVRRLVRASSKARAALGVAPVVTPLVSMLSSSEDHEATEVALLALLNLAVRNEGNKVGLVKFGFVPPLVELLKSDSSRLRELATAAILTLSASKCNRPIIASSGVPSLLVQVLVSGSTQAKVDAVTTLYYLSSAKETADLCLSVDFVQPLLSLLKDCKKNTKFAEKATALLDILAESEEGRTQISQYDGGILALVETVEDGSMLSVEYAVSTLYTMCSSCREKYKELILNEGVIPGLLLLTVYGSDKAKTKAKDLLDMLRDDTKPKQVTSDVLHTIVYDIASRVDGPDKAAETAGRLLQDMAHRNMAISIGQRQVEADGHMVTDSLL